MVEKKILVCDLCEQMPASRVSIEIDGHRSRMDLCERHSAPVRELLERATTVAAGMGAVDFSDVKDELGLR